jgi:predicted transcriptional regulator of viral defense system
MYFGIGFVTPTPHRPCPPPAISTYFCGTCSGTASSARETSRRSAFPVLRRARGVYVKPDHATTRHTDVAAVAARSPKAIVCLVSALDYHHLTTQVPHAVWIMIQKSAHRPTISNPAIRVVRASGPALTAGVEKREIEGVLVQMTSPAKTVADCFRYRDTVGTDVAVEALQDCLRKRKATPADIFEMAKVDRVARVMRPYLEALT